MSPGGNLRNLLKGDEVLVVPGAADALTARVIEEAGFSAIYATGAGFANASFALPDIGLITASEVVTHVARMTAALRIPLIVDADTGYGGVLQVQRTVRELERVGAAAIQLEDQITAKRCGHFDGQQLVSKAEMVQKIAIAVDSRVDPELVIIARTDARGVEGFDAAVDRAQAYAQAGADLLFIEAPVSREEMELLPSLFDVPLMVNLVEGGKTPLLDVAELKEIGFKVVLFANTALRASIAAVRDAMEILYRDGSSEKLLSKIVTWNERQELLRLSEYEAIDNRFTTL